MRPFRRLFAQCGILATFLGVSLASAQNVEQDIASIDDEIDEIIVTGSRIKRSTYTSIAPLQIIDAQESRQIGLIDAATILQESVAAIGIQHDLTAIGFVTENGPGASTVSLRGLGNARTLVLINGRRMAPAGVEGAPIAADINLVPGLLVQQYDLLLDGASSIYGSDAVAGVANIILRKDFDGFEAEIYTSSPEQSSGLTNTVSLAWGKILDRGYFGMGVEHQKSDPVAVAQRRWSADCRRHIEVDENGGVRYTSFWNQFNRDMGTSDCVEGTLVGTVELQRFEQLIGGVDPGPVLVFHTPGFSNTGIPNYSDGNYAFLPGGLDGDGDGQQDLSHYDYSINGLDNNRQILPEFERISTMLYGEYRMQGETDISPYFELQYSKRKVLSDAGVNTLAIIVPPDNPYNPCNPGGIDGVDCVVAWNDFYLQQTIIDRFLEEYGAPPQAFGAGQNPPVGGILVAPYLAIPGDRNLASVEVAQTRAVFGIGGNLTALNRGSLENWTFDAAIVFGQSTGTSSRPGIRNDWLDQSLQTSTVHPSTGEVVCGIDTSGDGIPDGFNTDGRACVPVNLFAPTLYLDLIGEFATQAEHDYLFDSRDFDTEYTQKILTAYVNGKLFDMPAGPVSAVLGFEYREDEIKSIPDEVARDALFHGFFGDAGAVGQKYTRELFAELELPLLADRPAVKELSVNVSGRYVSDEYFGSNMTYSAKIGWQPIDSLLLRATVGTSFRAPNLRENFLADLQGWTYLPDPCIPPHGSIGFDGVYDPALDTREPHVLRNCIDDGVDPTSFLYGSWQGVRIDFDGGGTTNLVAETSDSFTYGFVWEQTVFEQFDLTLGATYYEIDIADTIIKPNAGYIVNDCYHSPQLNSVLCSRITRDPILQYITLVNTDFINRDQYLATGYDVNASFDQSTTVFGLPLDLSADLVLNHPTEASETFTDSEGNIDYDDQAGEWGYPDWLGTLTVGASIRDYRFTWRTRYIGAVNQDPSGIDEWSDVTGSGHTCLGPSQGDVLCRDVGFADDYYVHAASIYYDRDTWTIGAGVRNVFDEAPPAVDGSEVFPSVRNMPLGYGYDLNGRTFFVNVKARFE